MSEIVRGLLKSGMDQAPPDRDIGASSTTNPNSLISNIYLVWFRLQGMRKDEASGFCNVIDKQCERCFNGNVWWGDVLAIVFCLCSRTCQERTIMDMYKKSNPSYGRKL
jgi:hypothetical protein